MCHGNPINLSEAFQKNPVWNRIFLPGSPKMPKLFAELQGYKFFDPKIIPLIYELMKKIETDILGFCKECEIKATIHTDMGELDESADCGVYVTTLKPEIFVLCEPSDFILVKASLPDILKRHSLTDYGQNMQGYGSLWEVIRNYNCEENTSHALLPVSLNEAIRKQYAETQLSFGS